MIHGVSRDAKRIVAAVTARASVAAIVPRARPVAA